MYLQGLAPVSLTFELAPAAAAVVVAKAAAAGLAPEAWLQTWVVGLPLTGVVARLPLTAITLRGTEAAMAALYVARLALLQAADVTVRAPATIIMAVNLPAVSDMCGLG